MLDIELLERRKCDYLGKIRSLNSKLHSLDTEANTLRNELQVWKLNYEIADHELALATKLTKINFKRIPSIKSTKDKISDITKEPMLAAKILAAIASQKKGIQSGFNGTK